MMFKRIRKNKFSVIFEHTFNKSMVEAVLKCDFGKISEHPWFYPKQIEACIIIEYEIY